MSNVYIVNGTGKYMDIDFQEGFARPFDDTVLLEKNGCDYKCRECVDSVWGNWKLIAKQKSDKRIKSRYCDAMMFPIASGWETLVNEDAMLELNEYIASDCRFMPVELEGAPQLYYALYITNIIDALDEKNSLFGEPISYENNKRRIVKEEYNYNIIGDSYLFRLPGWKYSSTGLHDYATARFYNLVKDLNISGFVFRDNFMASGKIYEPVKCNI